MGRGHPLPDHGQAARRVNGRLGCGPGHVRSSRRVRGRCWCPCRSNRFCSDARVIPATHHRPAEQCLRGGGWGGCGAPTAWRRRGHDRRPRIGTAVWRRPLVASVLREKEAWFIEHGQGRCPRSPVMASSVVAGDEGASQPRPGIKKKETDSRTERPGQFLPEAPHRPASRAFRPQYIDQSGRPEQPSQTPSAKPGDNSSQ